MRNTLVLLLMLFLAPLVSFPQDLGQGLVANDLSAHPMQDIAKPAYLGTITDPSFGTTIRRISDAGNGGVIVPMYSTIQAWNADESMMILYDQGNGVHRLLNGMDYTFIRNLSDVAPDDVEQIFWDFNDPDVFFYPQGNNDFIKYTVSTQNKEVLANLDDIVSNCSGNIALGNDVQMMSWDSDVVSYRCNNDRVYFYRISTGTVTEINISTVNFAAPMPGPSGNLFYHNKNVYDSDGNLVRSLNTEEGGEHASLGRLPNGNDAYFAIAFAQGPDGGCIGDIIAHDMTTGVCFPVISESQGYEYPQSGTHLSALAHKNTEGGWIAASMMGYDLDGQSLLDQELVIAKAEQGNIAVYRIGHHRSDEVEFDYWGEPHAVLSPSGTRVLFGSDWSGTVDGQSVDSYVVELPAFSVVLPVEFTSFSALEDDCNVNLNWETATELNNSFFEVQRSADGTSFNSIGTVTGGGTSTSPLYYQFEDEPGQGNWAYRIRQVDEDGSYSFSDIVQLQVCVETPSSFIAPNPTSNESILEFEALRSGPVTIIVYTLSGKKVRSDDLTIQAGERVQYTIELLDLPAATYLVELVIGSEKIVHKLVKR